MAPACLKVGYRWRPTAGGWRPRGGVLTAQGARRRGPDPRWRARNSCYSAAPQDRRQLLAICHDAVGLHQSRDAVRQTWSLETIRGLCGRGLYPEPQRHYWRQRHHGCEDSAQSEDAESRRLRRGSTTGRGPEAQQAEVTTLPTLLPFKTPSVFGPRIIGANRRDFHGFQIRLARFDRTWRRDKHFSVHDVVPGLRAMGELSDHRDSPHRGWQTEPYGAGAENCGWETGFFRSVDRRGSKVLHESRRALNPKMCPFNHGRPRCKKSVRTMP